MPHLAVRPRVPVSILCVSNEADVLRTSLKHSVEAQRAVAPHTELLVLDNREHEFSSAGAALNAGVRRAKNGVVVMVHQDVVLHSLPALEEVAAELFVTPEIGLLGAAGIDAHGRIVGRVRDRVVMIGERAPLPVEVESVDEVLLMAPTGQLLREPLSEDPDLAWHAYGVEYAARMRAQGLRTVARDVPLTHNSLSINLARLQEAHTHVGSLYPQLLPLRTTCGTIHRPTAVPELTRALRRWHGVRTWAGESRIARTMADVGQVPVLADVRTLVDEAARAAGAASLTLLDLNPDARVEHTEELTRFGVPLEILRVDTAATVSRLAARRPDELVVITGLDTAALRRLAPGLPANHVPGCSADTGRWVLVGLDPAALPGLCPGRRHRPLPRVASLAAA